MLIIILFWWNYLVMIKPQSKFSARDEFHFYSDPFNALRQIRLLNRYFLIQPLDVRRF